MSDFDCPIVRVKIEPHPNADAIELAVVGDYQSIVTKGKFKDGDRVVYIPEQALVPERIIEELGLVGKLHGTHRNRVKAIKLRGVVSEGLILTLPSEYEAEPDGTDLSTALGILKYEPNVPNQLRGAVAALYDLRFKFDIENIKKYNNVYQEGEEVIVTEKLHGTFAFFGYTIEEDDRLRDNHFFVGSKGLGRQGHFFKEETDNVYTKQLPKMREHLLELAKNVVDPNCKYVFIIGEILGVQGGFTYGNEEFRAFGLGTMDNFDNKEFLSFWEIERYLPTLPVVPILYQGPFNKEAIKLLTEGKETVSGKEQHMREGVVIYPKDERYSPELRGRCILKFVGDEYLMKSTGEEFQ